MDNKVLNNITVNLKEINKVLPGAISTTVRLIKIALILILLLVIISLVGAGYSLYEKEDKSSGYKIGLYTGTGVSGILLVILISYLIYQYNSFDNCLKPIKSSLEYISKDLTELQNKALQSYQNVKNVNTARQVAGVVRKGFSSNSIPVNYYQNVNTARQVAGVVRKGFSSNSIPVNDYQKLDNLTLD